MTTSRDLLFTLTSEEAQVIVDGYLSMLPDRNDDRKELFRNKKFTAFYELIDKLQSELRRDDD